MKKIVLVSIMLICMIVAVFAQKPKNDSIEILRDAIVYMSFAKTLYPTTLDIALNKAYYLNKLHKIASIETLYLDLKSVKKIFKKYEGIEEEFIAFDSFRIKLQLVNVKKVLDSMSYEIKKGNKIDNDFYYYELSHFVRSNDTIWVALSAISYTILAADAQSSDKKPEILGPYDNTSGLPYVFVKRRRYWEWIPHNRINPLAGDRKNSLIKW